MSLTIKNCNNITEATLSIEVNRLNIKFGINGTGKSTIAKALELDVNPQATLAELTPFKYRSKNEQNMQPLVEGNLFKSIHVFNEAYVNQFVFQKDEILKNSFNVFIKNADYDQKMAAIEKLISDIKNVFINDPELTSTISDLNSWIDSYGKSDKGYAKSGRIAKSIGDGNKVENVPDELTPYTKFIKSDNNMKWIAWQIQGNDFLKISTDCPYCTVSTEDKKDTILSVANEYNPKMIEHLNFLRGIFDKITKYFNEDTQSKLSLILTTKTGLTPEQINYLVLLKNQIVVLKDKLDALKNISFFSFDDVDKVLEKITSLRIDIQFLPNLTSETTQKIVAKLNGSLESVLAKVNLLQREIKKQNHSISQTIDKYNSQINTFLKFAGYKYHVTIEFGGADYKMQLKHHDFHENLSDAKAHLSYGEKNAFALVLFMYESLMKMPDLIILDDPISSFDRNKKFAIMEMLFRGTESLRDKTVLMLTHDIEPVVDVIKTLRGLFNQSAVASFLSLKSGIIRETKIEHTDLISFSQVCEENMKQNEEEIIKLIYLRRYYEILDDKGLGYHMLSSLFKKHPVPNISLNGERKDMNSTEIDCANAEIRKKIPDFNYTNTLGRISNQQTLLSIYESTPNNYEKLQLFRIINSQTIKNIILRKFVEETYHIENELITQLNPKKYDFVPNFIIEECDILLSP